MARVLGAVVLLALAALSLSAWQKGRMSPCDRGPAAAAAAAERGSTVIASPPPASPLPASPRRDSVPDDEGAAQAAEDLLPVFGAFARDLDGLGQELAGLEAASARLARGLRPHLESAGADAVAAEDAQEPQPSPP